MKPLRRKRREPVPEPAWKNLSPEEGLAEMVETCAELYSACFTLLQETKAAVRTPAADFTHDIADGLNATSEWFLRLHSRLFEHWFENSDKGARLKPAVLTRFKKAESSGLLLRAAVALYEAAAETRKRTEPSLTALKEKAAEVKQIEQSETPKKGARKGQKQ